MKKLNRGILSSGNFWEHFIRGGFFWGILSSKQLFAGDFIRGSFFPDTIIIACLIQLLQYAYKKNRDHLMKNHIMQGFLSAQNLKLN